MCIGREDLELFYHLDVTFFSFVKAYLIGNINRGKLLKGEVTSWDETPGR
jgi:hypothetical protein